LRAEATIGDDGLLFIAQAQRVDKAFIPQTLKKRALIAVVLVLFLDCALRPRSAAAQNIASACGPDVHGRLYAGQPIKCDPKAPIRLRTIPASWINELARPPARLINEPIHMSDAVIEGPLDLKYATFEYEVSFKGCIFIGRADFSYATFGRKVEFLNSRFLRPPDFSMAEAKRDMNLIGTVFPDGSSFADLHVTQELDARNATFGRVTFTRMEVGKSAFFGYDKENRGVKFNGPAVFRGAHIHSDAVFIGASFWGEATFDRMQVDGNAFFRPDERGRRVLFAAEAHFPRVHVGANAYFQGVDFEGEADFDWAQIDGAALFGPGRQHPARFGCAATFSSAVFGSIARFVDANFIQGVDFRSAVFSGAADFTGTTFWNYGGEAIFTGARFERGLSFHGATFSCPTDFASTAADQDAEFEGAEFDGPLSLRDARFRTAHFRENITGKIPPGGAPQFQANVDLRGFTYDRIYVAWRELFSKMEYDRQPYTQMEKALRESGFLEQADGVYRALRDRERESTRTPLQLRVWDYMYGPVAGYGTLVWPLWVFLVLLLLLGSFLFARPGALVEEDCSNTAQSVRPFDSFGVSLRLLIRVRLPAGSSLVPSQKPICGHKGMRYSTYATCHVILGWLTIAYLALSIAGRIRHP
jgi:uncharacterized protein YjbI with pentapeptide repeats